MVRRLYCSSCKIYLGEITKATLKKDISYLCGKCEAARKLASAPRRENPFDSLFRGIYEEDKKR